MRFEQVMKFSILRFLPLPVLFLFLFLKIGGFFLLLILKYSLPLLVVFGAYRLLKPRITSNKHSRSYLKNKEKSSEDIIDICPHCGEALTSVFHRCRR